MRHRSESTHQKGTRGRLRLDCRHSRSQTGLGPGEDTDVDPRHFGLERLGFPAGEPRLRCAVPSGPRSPFCTSFPGARHGQSRYQSHSPRRVYKNSLSPMGPLFKELVSGSASRASFSAEPTVWNVFLCGHQCSLSFGESCTRQRLPPLVEPVGSLACPVGRLLRMAAEKLEPSTGTPLFSPGPRSSLLASFTSGSPSRQLC